MKYLYLFCFIFFINYASSNEVRDPFEDFNRKTFEFNEKLDENILKPIAQTYSKLPPKFKNGVSNFFNNLEDVETSINQLLQGKKVTIEYSKIDLDGKELSNSASPDLIKPDSVYEKLQ